MALSKVVTWNGIASTDVPGLVIGKILRDPIGEIRTAMIPVPGRDGAWVFPQNRGMRSMVVEAFIEEPTTLELRATNVLFSDWLDVLGQAYLQISDDPGVFYEAVLESVTEDDAWRGVGIYTITWALQPYALSDAIEVEAWTADDNDVHIWDPQLGIEVFPVIQVTPTNGTLEGFQLITNDSFLTYFGSVADDATITINSISLVVLLGVSGDGMLTGAYNPAAISMQYVDGEFPVLYPGGNNEVHFIKTGGTATTINISVSYRKKIRR